MTGRVVVEADGGSRGNPGPAGYGAVVRDADTGAVLREVAAGIGVASNNVAEYSGLIAGLQAALDLGAETVDVRMDSLLVVNQMTSTWKVKHEAMKPLASQAAALVRRFRSVRFQHIPRELNSHADRLANEAMDAAAAGREWRAPAAEKPAAAPGGTGWAARRGRPTAAWLLRHGETALSPERRFSGRGDVELSERGQAQAAAAAKRLASEVAEPALIATSPLARARQTAEAVAAATGARVVVDDDLVETDFGAWEGLTFREIAARWPEEFAAWSGDPAVAPPGGESFAATQERVTRARRRLVESAAEGAAVIVSHMTPIKSMVRDALQASPQVFYRMHLDLASLSRVDWYADGSGVLRLFNDTSHLGNDLRTHAV